MSSDFPHYNFRMPNIGFQNLPLNIYIVVFGTAIFVFILSLLFCCYLIRLRHQAHKEFYAYKQVILKEKVKELNLHELCAVCLEDFKPRDELGICPCKHAFHRKCLIKWLEVRKVCPLCNMPVLQLAQLHTDAGVYSRSIPICVGRATPEVSLSVKAEHPFLRQELEKQQQLKAKEPSYLARQMSQMLLSK